jgi:hypothetical protein
MTLSSRKDLLLKISKITKLLVVTELLFFWIPDKMKSLKSEDLLEKSSTEFKSSRKKFT